MTYFAFLGIFLGIPIVALGTVHWIDRRRGRLLPAALRTWPPEVAIGVLMLIAVIYTSPWDNYLVATAVWWYDARLVSGIILGYVPLEEYLFFVVQPIMTGLLWTALARRIPPPPPAVPSRPRLNRAAASTVMALGAACACMLLTSWTAATYAALEVSWAALPIAIQLAFGADILWHHRTLVLSTLLSATSYLALADGLAILGGTWTIDPAQSCGVLLFGVLPIEEALFFLLTNCLVVFGMTLALAGQSQARLPAALRRPGHTPAADPGRIR